MFADVGFRERLAYASSKTEVTKTFSGWAAPSASAAQSAAERTWRTRRPTFNNIGGEAASLLSDGIRDL
jgi:hypothetical protein